MTNPFSLQGKLILITGASSGIGRQCAISCTEAGAKVIALGRNEKELLQHSGLMCLDFDHVGNPDKLKEQLLKHEYFDTELMFTSPSGDGVKWIIPIELKGWEHARLFKAVANCIKSTGLPPVDNSGSDVARSCFLPYDPQAYINPKYEEYVKENLFRPRMGECPF